MGGDGDSGARRAGSGGERSGHAPSAGAQAVRTLGLVTAALPHGEPRSGQADMAEAVAEAVVSGRHLVVQAGTGTGKSLAYLVPAILSGRPTVVATATKALQDQLATKDLPFLSQHLAHPFDWAILKGRSNYLCLQRVREMQQSDSGQLEFEHYGYGEPRTVHYELVRDAARYDPSAATVTSPVLIFQGRRDELVDAAMVEAFAATRPNVRLRLFDDDHRLYESLPAICQETEAFLGVSRGH